MVGEGFNLGNAYGAVIIDVSGVSVAMRQAKQAIDGGLGSIGDSISAIGDKMSALGGAINTFSLPLLAVGGVGLKAAADFDTLLKQIEIFGDVAPSQMARVSEFALKMGADTKFSSSDAAAALLELLKSGQSLDQAMQTLPEVLSLAATGNLNLATASGVVSSGLAIFSLKATDAARVSNALARAANASRADVGDLGQAMVTAGPVAAMYGINIEDLSAALGIFANAGLSGSEAGTQLKTVLLNMHRTTDDVEGALKKLNVQLSGSDGKPRELNAIIKDLDVALDKLPLDKQNELMQTLGGSYGIVGLNALRTAGGLDTMRAAMEKAPTAAEVAASFMNTFSGKIESLTGSLETLMISGLTPFMNDYLAPLVSRITEVVNSITDWTQKNPELTKQIVKVLAAVAVLGPGLSIAGKAMSSIGKIVSILLGSFGAMSLVVAGLVLAFQTNFLGIRDFIQPVVDQVTAFFNAITNGVPIGDALGVMLRNLVPPEVANVITGIVTTIQSFVDLLQHGIDPLTAFGVALLDGFGPAAAPITEFLFNLDNIIITQVIPALQRFGNWFTQDALPAVISFIQTSVIPGIQTLFTFLSNAWATISPGLNSLKDWFLTDALPKVKTFVEGDFKTAIETVFNWLRDVWENNIKPGLDKLRIWFLEEALPKVKTFVEVDFKNALDTVFGWLGRVWEETIKPGLDGLRIWFLEDALPKIKNFVEVDFKNALDTVFGWLGKVWEETIKPGLEDMKRWFTEGGLQEVIKSVQTFFENIDKLPGKIQAWIDKQGPLVRLLEDAIIAIGILSGLMVVYNVLASVAAGISVAVAGGIGAIRAAVSLLLGPIGLAVIALTALIALYHEVARLQASYADTQAAGIAGINANHITREEYLNRAFASSVSQLGDAGARLTWGSTTKGNYLGVGGMAAKFYDENVASGAIRDKGGPGMAGMAYQIGSTQLKNEVYIPGADGQFVSGFVDLMKQVAANVGGQNGGQQFGDINVMMPPGAIANPAAAYAAGQDFGRGIQDEMRARGVKPLK